MHVLHCTIATSVRGVTLNAAHLDSLLNFALLACMAKFKTETKCTVVKVPSLTEVALTEIVTGGPHLMRISLLQFFQTFHLYLAYAFLANFISLHCKYVHGKYHKKLYF